MREMILRYARLRAMRSARYDGGCGGHTPSLGMTMPARCHSERNEVQRENLGRGEEIAAPSMTARNDRGWAAWQVGARYDVDWHCERTGSNLCLDCHVAIAPRNDK